MFTDLLNFPLNKERARQSDQILSLTNMNWSDYEQFTNEEYLGYRASYYNRVITIVSPSLKHETIAEVISGLIKTYCRKYSLLYFPMGLTTLKNPPLAGKEPDTSYSFKTKKNTPDLAVEVIFYSGNIDDSLTKYKYLKVSEVWFWENNKICFYQLIDDNYVESERSLCLPKLSSNFLIDFVNRGLTESPLIIEADFLRELGE